METPPVPAQGSGFLTPCTHASPARTPPTPALRDLPNRVTHPPRDTNQTAATLDKHGSGMEMPPVPAQGSACVPTRATCATLLFLTCLVLLSAFLHMLHALTNCNPQPQRSLCPRCRWGRHVPRLTATATTDEFATCLRHVQAMKQHLHVRVPTNTDTSVCPHKGGASAVTCAGRTSGPARFPFLRALPYKVSQKAQKREKT